MDSEDESRPGSSASNSSDSSDDNNSENNSRASSPEAPKRSKSGSVKSAASVKSTTSMKSGSNKSGSASPQSGGERAVSRSSRVSSRSSRASSKSNSGSSSSSSSSSSDDDDEAGSAKENNKSPSKPASSRSSSEESGKSGKSAKSGTQRQGVVSRNQSISPVRRKSRSSRNSSVSSAGGSIDDNREDGAINMSHEDLSDVSEMDSEKRLDHGHKETTKMSIDDEATNGSITNTNDLDRPQEPEEEEKEHATEENNSRHSRNEDDDDDDDDDDDAGEIVENSKKQDTIKKDDEKEEEQEREHERERERSHDPEQEDEPIITDLRQKLDKKKACQQKVAEKLEEDNESQCGNKNNGNVESDIDDLVKKHDEDALDFEAEEGECPEVSKEEQEKIDEDAKKKDESNKSDGEAEEGEELEEGEVSDEDEKRPEETEPKPVCRFYTRGQCTWGMSCRFLHPGVTDKGNYTMFDMVRPVSVPTGGGRPPLAAAFGHDNYHDYRTDRPPLHHRAPPIHHHPAIPFVAHHDPRAIPPVAAQDPPIVESAWERGLRTAKEMMRKANKRKEQDMDFEDKKMNLTLSPDDVEKDNYYIKDRATPPEVVPQYPRHQNYQEPPGLYPPPERFARGPPPIYDDLDPYGRSARYRELPAHRMPHYEDERRVRPAREVIVQRVEPVGRGDEWNDPWMRSKSPGGRALSDRERSDKRRRDRRSYSSNSSYSSSTSSQSDSSSESSRSPSPEHRRRYNSSSHKSPPPRRHFRSGGGAGLRSPSPRRPRRSPSIVRSPVAKRRGHSSPSPIPEKRSTYSPSNRKRRASPPPKKSGTDRNKKRRGSSSSGSSDSSGSGSDSSSSSSESSSQSRGATPVKRMRTTDKIANERKAVKKIEAVKKRSPISIEIKKQATVGASALTSPSNSNSSDKPEVKDMKKNRREELLKQLRAVEDAIAKKRSKLT
ncbi:zinc finger CCCH domain-containing protein 18 isoform X2 [Episyrphus balteatus]|uniref:zinc finger CCCH domain-containing protein 18 isoform X2 n=1 Tax=Episyrphus balteatus TaxID=286459 RepID=UPI00248643E6|nr:zinc finger CCCH domain-containing protein 18 isoform X2 [Episyrphus balteatus]